MIRNGFRKGMIAAVVCATPLTACNVGDAVIAPDDYVRDLFGYASWKPSTRSPDSYVELITLEHVVRYEPATARFGDVERGRLRSFLSRINLGPQDQVALFGPQRDAGRHDPVTTARLQFLRGEMAVMGIQAKVPSGQLGAQGSDRISVVVSRPVVITPDCRQGPAGRGERPQFVMGCTTHANLGNMIANPLDLANGREPSPADGEASALGIKRYRDGEAKALKSAITETTK